MGFCAIVIAADTRDYVLSDFTNFMRTIHRSDLQSFDVTNDRIDSFSPAKESPHAIKRHGR